jgi:agmatinase
MVIELISALIDAHLDTWGGIPEPETEEPIITHGTFFAVAQREGLISNSSIHAGIRCKLAVRQSHLHCSK